MPCLTYASSLQPCISGPHIASLFLTDPSSGLLYHTSIPPPPPFLCLLMQLRLLLFSGTVGEQIPPQRTGVVGSTSGSGCSLAVRDWGPALRAKPSLLDLSAILVPVLALFFNPSISGSSLLPIWCLLGSASCSPAVLTPSSPR